MTQHMNVQFERLYAASRSSPLPSLLERRDRLDRLKALIVEGRAGFVEAISNDFGGRARSETELLEMVPALTSLSHARKHVARWMQDERRHVSMTFRPSRAWIRYEPLGVIGVISPWNYPLLLALSPMIDALAAGNRVMLKPSELTPTFSNLLAQCIAMRFADDEVAVTIGDVDVARSFSSLPFDHLVFTGSTEIGRHVMRAAAENLTPLTLELGGKSPAIIDDGYPLDKAASSISFGKFINAGQTCIAPDYVMVPEQQASEFGQMVLSAAQASYPSIEDNSDYTNIISDRHRSRLRQAISEAHELGSIVLTHPDATNSNGKLPPTVIINPHPDSLLLKEEIFGPILPVLGYKRLEDAVSFTKKLGRPLALYSFSNSKRFHETLMERVISGGTTLNGTLLHIGQDDLPFGGVGSSGTGSYHGVHGFRRFSHARAVHHVGKINTFEMMGPPWRNLAAVTTKILLR